MRKRSIEELRYSQRLLDTLGTPDGTIVLHVGGVYGDRRGVIERLRESLLPETGLLRYLALENDERLWNASQTLKAAETLGVPVIFDAFHHALNPGDESLEDALDAATATWKRRRNSRPKVHLSSQAPEKRPGAYAGRIHSEDLARLLETETFRGECRMDLMVEAKDSDLAALEVVSRLSEPDFPAGLYGVSEKESKR